jgi:hypothetical protein
LTIEVKGKAYYPDDVELTIDVRYWKLPQVIQSTKAKVKNRAFSARLGPYNGTIPGGELTVEAWFYAGKQPATVKQALLTGFAGGQRYYHCQPACRWDKQNCRRATISFGGKLAQDADEQLEKSEIDKARKAFLDAQQVADRVFDDVRNHRGNRVPADAEAALKRFVEDRKAAAFALETWTRKRAFLLFEDWVMRVQKLGELLDEQERLDAAVAGATVPGMPLQNAFPLLTRSHKATTEASNELRVFLDEKDTLDANWAKLQEEKSQPKK